MGHYDDCYDYQDEKERESTKKEIIDELDNIKNKNDMFLIQKLIRRRDQLKVFFDILQNGLQ